MRHPRLAPAILALVATGSFCACGKAKEAPKESPKAEAASSPLAAAELVAQRAEAIAAELAAEAAEAGINAPEAGSKDLRQYVPAWLRAADSFVQSTVVPIAVGKDLDLPQRTLEPVTQDEIQSNVKPIKCPSIEGFYLDALPADGSEARECWQEVRGGGGGYVQSHGQGYTESRFVGSGRFWEKMYWQPKFRRWDRLTETDRLRERRLVLDKQYGQAAQAESQNHYLMNKPHLDPIGLRNAFFGAHGPRVIHQLVGLKLDQMER